MTDGTRILRILALPLIIAFVFLFVLPKTCKRAVEARRARAAAQQTATTASTTESDGELHIQSITPENAGASRQLDYPTGLDAQRAQYLIEVNPHFGEPMSVRLPKPGGLRVVEVDAKIGPALTSRGYFVENAGGYLTTRDGQMKIDGLTEDANAWRVPIARRKFGTIRGASDKHDGSAVVQFTWQWEPTTVGHDLKSSFDVHTSVALFNGGGGHAWDLTSISQLDNEWR
jgi:hypothetical protein